MAKNKTTETEGSVADYLAAIANETRRNDCSTIVSLVAEATGLAPKMWGAAIVGFGSYHYKYASGHEGDSPLFGFASRANAISLYFSANFPERDELLAQFGKYKASKACIYIQKLADIDVDILVKMAKLSVEHKRDLAE